MTTITKELNASLNSSNLVSVQMDVATLEKLVTKRSLRQGVKKVLASADFMDILTQDFSELTQSVMLTLKNLHTINSNDMLRDSTIARVHDHLIKGLKKELREYRPCKRIVNPIDLDVVAVRKYLDIVEQFQSFIASNDIQATDDSDDESND